MLRYTLLLVPVALAACSPEGNSTITLNGEDGNVSIVTDANGNTTISGPGGELSLKTNKINLKGDMEVSGIKLYPGSTVRDFTLEANTGGDNGKERVVVAFDAPASLDKVQAWFRDKMNARKFKVSPQGNGFAGTTENGDPVTLELNADGDAKTVGKMTIGA